jgi:hypothetical protein
VVIFVGAVGVEIRELEADHTNPNAANAPWKA